MPDHEWRPATPPGVTSWQPFVAELEGRFVAASNATLLGFTADEERVVYKPIAGERPLWDFPPDSLAGREVLTYLTSEILGLHVVPETVMGDGIYGPGAVQRFIEIDEEWDPVPEIRAGAEVLWPLALLDLVSNNADRKVGHILKATDGTLYGIDHGLTFHEEDKLRTVLWAFAGESIPPSHREGLLQLHAAALSDSGLFAEYLLDFERAAFITRLEGIIADPTHPEPPTDRPPVPWPAY